MERLKDLEQLKQKVLQEVTDEYSQKLAVATKVEEERLNEANARLSEQEMTKKASLKKAAKNQLEREKQAIQNASKKEVLQVKRELLTSVYDETVRVMSNWSGETLVTFISGAISSLNLSDSQELVFGEQTVDLVTDEQKQALTTQFPNISISTETIAKKAGFVIMHGGIEYNYLFDELVNDLKLDYSPVLAKMVFDEQ